MPKLKLQLEAIQVVSFDPAPIEDPGMEVVTPRCVVTGGIDSCWCSEYNTCDCV